MNASPASPDDPREEPLTGTPDAPDQTPPDDLPEIFELTPEYVEEEAIRGDFVIRWAVILLGVLLGWTQISSSQVLLRIRAGEQLASSGLLPTGEDSLSYSATDREWIHREWLGDLLLYAVHAVGGVGALSILAGIIGGLTLWLLSRISIPGLPTWWSSICHALAAIAIFPLLTAGPALFTLLGLALTLVLIDRWRQNPGHSRALWGLAPLLLIWVNCDPRAFLGLCIVAATIVGAFLSQKGPDLRRTLAPLFVALAAGFISPFPLEAIRAPVDLVKLHYPLMREYGGSLAVELPELWRPVFSDKNWSRESLSVPVLLGTVLALLAAVSLLFNWRRIELSHVILFLFVNWFGTFAGIDFFLASVVNAVIAALNGQMWYQDNWRQEYSASQKELVIGRVGRALTVFAIFLAAFWHVSGRLAGPAARRVGIGLSPELAAEVRGYRELLGKVPYDELDDHPWHLTPRQGDLLVWLGRRSFTDSRLELFAAPGNTDLLKLQDDLAKQMQSPDENLTTRSEVLEWADTWQSVLDQYEITHVVLPLTTARGFALWVNLSTQAIAGQDSISHFWREAGRNGQAAVLYRTDPDRPLSPELVRFLQKNASPSIVEQTFTPDTDGVPVTRGMFPAPPTFYDARLLLPRPEVSNDILLARHLARRQELAQRSLPESLAYNMQVVRLARRGLAEHPQHEEGFLLLAEAYSRLWGAETTFGHDRLSRRAADQRFLQAIFAYHHAIVVNPLNPQPHAGLYPLYLAHNDYDLALHHLNRVAALTGALTLLDRSDRNFSARQQMAKRLKEEIESNLQKSHELIEQALEIGLESAVATALQVGCPLRALELIESDLTIATESPELAIEYTRLLLLTGRTEEAFQRAEAQLRNTEPAGRVRLLPWAVDANLAADLYDRAIEHAAELADARLQAIVDTYLSSLPLQSTLGPQQDAWPIFQTITAREGANEWLPGWEIAQWQIAMCHLEQGQNATARTVLQQILEESPGTPLRPLVAIYLTLLSGENINFVLDPPPGTSPSPSAQEAPGERPQHPDRPPAPPLPDPLRDDE